MADLSSRQSSLIAISARVALLVIAFQIAALDHHFGISNVVGVEGSSAHTLHCHGETSGCADAASGAVASIHNAFALPRPILRPLALESVTARPRTVNLQAEPEPPRL
jgi:hypothetical protein